MTISIPQAKKMIDELRDREISLGRDPKTWYTYETHVYGVAQIAKAIAERTKTMDPDRSYVMGLLHDICRTEEDRFQRFHGILGYEKLVGMDPEVARTCLLHSFAWDELLPYPKCTVLFFNKEKDYRFIADFIQKNPPKDEDYLIQLCDNLANKNGFVTIEDRAKEIIERHTLLHPERFISTEKNNRLKQYFEEKINCNIYDLFQGLKIC